MADLHTGTKLHWRGLNLKGNFVLIAKEKAHNLTKVLLPLKKSRVHPKWEYGNVLIWKKTLWNLALACILAGICQGLVQVVELQAICTTYLYGTLFCHILSDHLLTERADEIILESAAKDTEKEQHLHRSLWSGHYSKWPFETALLNADKFFLKIITHVKKYLKAHDRNDTGMQGFIFWNNFKSSF